MSRSLTEINKSVPGAVLAGVKREVRHTKNTRRLRKLTPEAMATENAKRATVGLPPQRVSGMLRQRMATIGA